MLFKRYLFLTACVLLFIVGFIAYFTYGRLEMDSQFREEREKFNVQGVTLTSTSTPYAVSAPTPALPAISSSGTSSTSTPDTSAPASASTDSTSNAAPATTDSPTPAMNPAASDPNIIIGPVPPPPSTPTPAPAPDSSTNAAPVPTDSTTAPMAPSSTMNDTRQSLAPFLVRAAYHPVAQSPTNELTRPGTPTPAEPVPTVTGSGNIHSLESTNSAASKATTTNNEAASVPATNAAPETASSIHAAGSDASVIVLLYHQFTPPDVHASPKMQWTMNVTVFAEEMKYIHDNGYHVIPMSDLIKFLHHEIGLPPKSVVITIDDGYKSAVVYAAPILKQYGYPWTFFIYPDFVTVNEGKGAVSWNDLLALQADGVDIESHSMTHPQLPKHTQKWKGSVHLLSPEEYDEWLTNETLGSKTILEQKMGKQILCLAYPYGAYNKEVEAKAISAGYQYIFTVADNPVRNSTDPHSIGRYTITQGVEKNFAAYLRQGALGLSEADPAPGTTTSNPRPVITAVLSYAGTLDPNSIETEVRDFGVVKHDFDPKTSTIRLYLPRDLIQQVNLVNIRVKDAQTGQIMVANWHFNFEPASGAGTHAPIAPASTNAAPESTNAPAAVPLETPMAAGTNAAPSAINTAPAAVVPVKPATNAAPAGSKAHQD